MKIARLLVLLIPLCLSADQPAPLSDAETIEWLELQLQIAQAEAVAAQRSATVCEVKLTAMENAGGQRDQTTQLFRQLAVRRDALQSRFAQTRGISLTTHQLQSDRTWIAVPTAAPTQASGEAASRQGTEEGPEEP